MIGLGKIGLPLAVSMALGPHAVTGIDTSVSRLVEIRSGGIASPEAGLEEGLTQTLATGRLTLSTDLRDVATSEVILVVIPVGLDANGRPDLATISRLATAIGRLVQPGTLIIFETTLPIGTTRTVLTPAITSASGLALGSEVFIAYSPERVFTGRFFDDLRAYPKIVGGVDRESGSRAAMFYSTFIDFVARNDTPKENGVWLLGSADSAEFVKLAETTYRDVNIALANEFAIYADRVGLDIWEVIEAANSQPFSHLHRPGASVGGHCIPVYPRFYLFGDPEASVPKAARDVNRFMPTYVLKQLEAMRGDLTGLDVGILGVTYRANVKETAGSGALEIAALLRSRGATVFAHDPLLNQDELTSLGFTPLRIPQRLDLLVAHTDDPAYRELREADFPGLKGVFDGRGALDVAQWPNVKFVRLGGHSTEAMTHETPHG